MILSSNMEIDNEKFDVSELSNFLYDTNLLEREKGFNLEEYYDYCNGDNHDILPLADTEESIAYEMQQDPPSRPKFEAHILPSSGQVSNELKKKVSDDVELSIFKEIEKLSFLDETKDESFNKGNYLIEDSSSSNEDYIDFLINDSSTTDDDDMDSQNEDMKPYDVRSNHIFNSVTQSKAQLPPFNGINTDENYSATNEEELIQFQKNLNKQLESLLVFMKNTEQSRKLLARHSCNSLINLNKSITQEQNLLTTHSCKSLKKLHSSLRQNCIQPSNKSSSAPLPHVPPIETAHNDFLRLDTNKAKSHKKVQKSQNPSLMIFNKLKHGGKK